MVELDRVRFRITYLYELAITLFNCDTNRSIEMPGKMRDAHQEAAGPF